jgi:hypothetical protein
MKGIYKVCDRRSLFRRSNDNKLDGWYWDIQFDTDPSFIKLWT